MTEFPCKFPCPWRNKTFTYYNSGIASFEWIFYADGQTSFSPENQNFLDCYQITERFLITRYVNIKI